MIDARCRNRRGRAGRRAFALGLAWLFMGALPRTAHAEADYTDLDLSELSALSARVTSVSGRDQRLLEAPAAVTVIDAETIRRSGHTTLPELLRTVPGLHVARVNTNLWAISARGFTNEFANKLLVLIDGRVIYTPTFSGVYWNLNDIPPEDIERIEVIRGPGATIWGSNAVNGVINVITKSAGDTSGDFVRALAGNEERGLTSFRIGREPSPGFHYRVFGRAFQRDGSVAADGHESPHEWSGQRAGFRADWERGDQVFTLDGEAFGSDAGASVTTFAPDYLTSGRSLVSDETSRGRGGHMLFRWRDQQRDGSARELQLDYDLQSLRDGLYDDVRHSAHGNFQQELAPLGSHNLTWGAAYRFTTTRLSSQIALDPSHDDRADSFWSTFLQDEIALAEPLRLALGSKVEWNGLAGWELEPSARVMYTPRDNHQLWAALSRSTRSPANAERDVTIRFATIGPNFLTGPTPIVIGTMADEHFRSEVLIATELGYRFQPVPNVALDFAAFWNDYENLRHIRGRRFPMLFNPVDNASEGRTFGGELSLDWRPSAWLRLTASYAQLRADFSERLFDEENAPRDRWQVHSGLDLPGNLELDTGVEYTSHVFSFTGEPVDRYFRVDARLAWQPTPALELSLVGQNLTNDQHAEWSAFLDAARDTEIERSAYAQVTWSF